VVLSQLLGDGSRSTKDRQAVAATIYMNPPLSSVGLTERDALAAGHTIKVAAKPVAAIAAMPRAKTLENPRGMLRDEIYTHPSITEGLNEVLANAVPVN